MVSQEGLADFAALANVGAHGLLLAPPPSSARSLRSRSKSYRIWVLGMASMPGFSSTCAMNAL